jgi:hypothetical protein
MPSAFRILAVSRSASAAARSPSQLPGAHAGDFIGGDTLLISTTTYENVGAVAGLVTGASQLPGKTAGTTSTAVSDGALNTIWNNASVDGSFGVTSAITLMDLNGRARPAGIAICASATEI